MPAGKKSRFDFIDAIRGIAACSVMLQHSLESSHIETLNRGEFGIDVLNFGETGVLAFFLVSGFVIPFSLEKWNDVRHFWINRAFRIYPLYLFIYGVTVALSRAAGPFSFHALLVNFMCHVLFVQEYVGQHNFVGGSWTLSLEAFWYLAFTCLFVIGFNRREGFIVAGAAVMSLIAATLTLTHIAFIPMGRTSFLVACVIGLLCFRRAQGSLDNRRFLLLAAALVLVVYANLAVGFLLLSGRAAASFRCVCLSWGLGFAVFLIPFFTASNPLWSSRPLTFVGKISYSVYLVHPVILGICARLQLARWLFIPTAFTATILISALTYAYIEAPAMAFAHSLRKRVVVPPLGGGSLAAGGAPAPRQQLR